MSKRSTQGTSRLNSTEKLLFDLPEYHRAFLKFVTEAIHSLASMRDPLLAEIPWIPQARMYHNRNTMPDGKSYEAEPMAIQTNFEITNSGHADCDCDALMAMIDLAADSYLTSIMPQVFAALDSVTAAAGTNLDAEGQPLSVELLARALEKIEIDFDDDGTPLLPAIVTGPENRIPEATPENQRKIDEIIARKRERFLAQRRYRELSGHPLRD